MSKRVMSSATRQLVRGQLSEMLKKMAVRDFESVRQPIATLLGKYPNMAEVNHVASGFFGNTGEREKAIYYAQRAIGLDPKVGEYQQAMGTLLFQKGEHAKAVECLLLALQMNPELHEAQSALGVSYLELGEFDKARKMLDNAIVNLPNNHEPSMNRALLESNIGHASKAVEMMRAVIKRFPDQSDLHDGLAMFSCYDDQLSPKDVFDIHKAFGQCVQSQVRVPRRYANKVNADKRIRIGFVSSDFKTHSIAYFLEPIFDHLDHDRFELCVYSTSSYTDQMTDRLRAKSDLWRECTSGVTQTHQRIVNDHVDVLVELNGHFASNSLPIFAAKPSPVSVTMIGYANTTGLESIDARLIDNVTDPSPMADELASEKLVRLPGCFLCYRPSAFLPAIQEQNADRAFTFGSFNDLRKMSPSTLKAWAKILARCTQAKLLLKTSRFSNSEVCDDIIERFKCLGVDESQVVLMGRTKSIVDHLDLYSTIDCALDTFPYTGTTTTCEALSMGVPTVTLMGESHAGRVSASLLTAIGREDLIAETIELYIDLAVAQAERGHRSVDERSVLRTQLEQSPLCDETAYTKKFENAISQLWGDWCQKQQEREASI